MNNLTLRLKQFFDLFRPMSIEDLKALSPSYIGGPPEVIPESVRFPETPIGASKALSTTRNKADAGINASPSG